MIPHRSRVFVLSPLPKSTPPRRPSSELRCRAWALRHRIYDVTLYFNNFTRLLVICAFIVVYIEALVYFYCFYASRSNMRRLPPSSTRTSRQLTYWGLTLGEIIDARSRKEACEIYSKLPIIRSWIISFAVYPWLSNLSEIIKGKHASVFKL